MEAEIIVKHRKTKLTKMLAMATAFSSLGSFQQGYTEWVIHDSVTITPRNSNTSQEERGLMNFDQTLTLLMKLTVIMFPVGGILGALAFGPLADKCGRKATLLKTNTIAVVAAILQGFSKALDLYNFDIFARWVAGMCAGAFSCVVPLYIGEIAPVNLRGAFILISVLFLMAGFLIARIMSLPELFGNKDGLPFLVSFGGIVGLLSIPLLMVTPESPRFLFIQRNDRENAKEVLQTLRGVEDVEDELADLQKEDIAEGKDKNVNAFKLLCFQPLRWHLLSAIIVMGGNELTGVRGAYFYSEKIFQSLDAKQIRVEFVSICIASLHMLIIFTVMVAADIVGRRFLLLIGFMACSVSCVLVTWIVEMHLRNPWIGFFSLVLLLFYFVGYLVGPGCLHSVIAIELFLQSSRASALVLCGLISWVTKLLAAIIFLSLEPLIGSYTMLFFWPLCIATFIYIFMILPETKCKTFLEIQEIMITKVIQRNMEQVPPHS